MKIVQTMGRWVGTSVLATGLLVGMASANGGWGNGWNGGWGNGWNGGWDRGIGGWNGGWNGGWGHSGWNFGGWNNWNRW